MTDPRSDPMANGDPMVDPGPDRDGLGDVVLDAIVGALGPIPRPRKQPPMTDVVRGRSGVLENTP